MFVAYDRALPRAVARFTDGPAASVAFMAVNMLLTAQRVVQIGPTDEDDVVDPDTPSSHEGTEWAFTTEPVDVGGPLARLWIVHTRSRLSIALRWSYGNGVWNTLAWFAGYEEARETIAMLDRFLAGPQPLIRMDAQ